MGKHFSLAFIGHTLGCHWGDAPTVVTVFRKVTATMHDPVHHNWQYHVFRKVQLDKIAHMHINRVGVVYVIQAGFFLYLILF